MQSLKIHKDKKYCGSCVFLEGEKKDGKKYCKELGFIESNKACKFFKPKISQLRSATGNQEVISLLESIRKVPAEHLQTISYLLQSEIRLRKQTRFKILQPVVILVNGKGEYLDDYCKAYVLDAGEDYIRFINKEGTLVAQLTLDSKIYTLKEFKTIKEKLLAEGKLQNPLTKEYSKIRRKEDLNEIPTIDRVVKEEKVGKTNIYKADLYVLFSELNK